MSGLALEKIGRADAQGFGYAAETRQGDVPLASLNAADVGPVEAGLLSEGFLRQPLPLADLPDGASEDDQLTRTHPWSL